MSSSEQKVPYVLCFIDRTADSCLIQLWIFIIHHACFHPLNHNHDTKEASHTLARTQTCIFRVQNVRYVHYEQTLSTAIHHTSKVSLLPENVKPCCDLPKQNTFPLLLLCLLHWNSHTATTSSRHKQARQTHRPTITSFQFANTTDYYMYRMRKPWKCSITTPQAAVTIIYSWHTCMARSLW